jgi:hypothetical protein
MAEAKRVAPSFVVLRQTGEVYAAILRSEWRIAFEHERIGGRCH